MSARSITYADVGDFDLSAADLMIATCGYESRAVHAHENVADGQLPVVAFGYPSHQVLAFDANHAYFSKRGEVKIPKSLGEFRSELEMLLRRLSDELDRPARVAIDISSMNRERIAACVLAVREFEGAELEVAFVYSVGTYDSQSEPEDTVILANGPLPEFEGWAVDPSRSVCAIVGLGFESLIALAALETLEPSRTVAFIAQSPDERFELRVLSDNSSLLAAPDVRDVRYDLLSPLTALGQLEGVVHALRRAHRIAVVPLGPKIFALLAVLLSAQYGHEFAVWRVSSDTGAQPHDRKALGPITGIWVRVG